MAAFDYNIVVTGDCSNTSSGRIDLLLSGGTPPYTVEWLDPINIDEVIILEPSIVSGLTSGVYAVRVNDSTLPINQEFFINIPISSGVCVEISEVNTGTCGESNGSVTVTSSSEFSSMNYFLYDDGNTLVSSGSTNTEFYEFTGLESGIYYIVGDDLGGCTGRTPNFIIQETPEINFGLYVVPNSSCNQISNGKIFITGLTGNPPYSYLWSNSFTGSSITGLSEGSYSVEVTDTDGCTKTQSATVTKVPTLGFGVFTSTPPSCFTSDGVINLTITGGSAPYYYSASTGSVQISYLKTFSLSGLSAGQYNFMVTDAGLCTLQVGTNLSAPEGITSVEIDSVNSTCSSTDGSILVTVVGGTSPYTYTLIYPNSSTVNITTTTNTRTFTNLSGGTYTVVVTDFTGCSFEEEIFIMSENKFTITAETTSTTCGASNGVVDVECSQGYVAPITYYLDNVVVFNNTSLSSVTINNVSFGQHTVKVTDSQGCSQTQQVFVNNSTGVNFSLFATSCDTGNDGKLTALINQGTPPYQFTWSNNVPSNPQQITVSGLTGGTYSLTIVDSNGCSLTRSTTISCNRNTVSYQSYIMGLDKFVIESPVKCSLLQMMCEGYFDLISGNTGCVLSSATFTAKVSLTPLGISESTLFYTSNSLVDSPSDQDWYDTIEPLLLSIPGVINVDIIPSSNQIKIETAPDNTTLLDQEVILELIINYEINCQS
jgi:uncharacterized protein (DUF2141 family)